MITGWGLLVCVIIGTIVTGAFLLAGGFSADVYTDVYEFILMFAGFGLIIPFAVMQYGGWDFLAAHLPPMHLSWHGGASPQFIIVWFFIALWTLVDPSFYQRCAAASSPAVARKGILWSVVFWLIFDMMTADRRALCACCIARAGTAGDGVSADRGSAVCRPWPRDSSSSGFLQR